VTLLHCAGHRKSNVKFVNGPQSSPLRPQPSLADQYVAVQPIDEDGGVRKDCAREKNANPMIYTAPRTRRSQRPVNGRVSLIRLDSRGKTRCCPRIFKWKSKSGSSSERSYSNVQ